MSYGLTKDNLKRQTMLAFEVSKSSAQLLVQQWLPLLIAWLISLAGPVALLIFCIPLGAIIDHAVGAKGPGWGVLAGILIPGIMIGGLWGGWIAITLKVARREKVHVLQDILRPVNQILAALLVLVITTVLVYSLLPVAFIGALLFLKWQLAPYYIVDRNFGPIEALKRSWNDTNAIWIPLGILDLLFYALQLLTAFTGVGPIICHLIFGVVLALVYDQWLNAGASGTIVKALPVD